MSPVRQELKLIFAGPMGAGKTTSIAAISDIEPLSTEVANSDRTQSTKATTTVALDYGEVRLDSGEKLKLFGTPGQQRFDFMWSHVAQGALGLIILLDCSRPDLIADLHRCLLGFPELVAFRRFVIGLSRQPAQDESPRHQVLQALDERGLNCPVISVDVRQRADVLLLIEILLHLLESNGEST